MSQPLEIENSPPSDGVEQERRALHVLAVVPAVFDTAPGQRFRIEQWDPLLRQQGISIEYAPFETAQLHEIIYKTGAISGKLGETVNALISRWRKFSTLQSYDLVYVFRECALIGPALFEQLIWNSRVPCVFDFDDAVFVRYISSSNGFFSLLKFAPSKTRSLCRHANHVIAGNQYLADFASQYNPGVTVIPTTIDTEKYTVAPAAGNDVPVICWSGSFSTAQYLKAVGPALKALARQIQYRLLVIGAGDYSLDGVNVDARPWRSSSEVSDLKAMDIGIMPLPDDEWARGKCGLKALQYMALGKPAVCSPVGVNSEIIRHGENGLLATSQEDWVANLHLLLCDSSTRLRMGAAARKTVENYYSARIQAPRVANIFKSVVRKHRLENSCKN